MAPIEGLNNIAPSAPEPRPALVNTFDNEGSFEDIKDARDLHHQSPYENEKESRDDVPYLFDQDLDDPDKIIKSGADAAQYMLSDRDDGDPAITVRSMVLGTAFAAFYASISQIYKVSFVICSQETRLMLYSSNRLWLLLEVPSFA
jgi:hypothetical protein